LAKTTGSVTTADFAVTPGTYQCFEAQAFNSLGTSGWSNYGCTSTPGLFVPGTSAWTDTGVNVPAGITLGIMASGTVYIHTGHPVSAAGDHSCIPERDHPGGSFPAPTLYCWSLIARIGNGAPFEVGTSTTVTTTSGRLYLGVNDDNFSRNSGGWTANIKEGGSSAAPVIVPTQSGSRVAALRAPHITRVETYQEGVLVYFRIYYTDPYHDADGFGFVGVDGTFLSEENHPFSSPSFGLVGPGRIDYPFNLACGTDQEDQNDVEAWIYDTAGTRSQPVVIHLACTN
jgi:hypothetical protein